MPRADSQAPVRLISLIGYRGTGKSTLAPLLARQLGWNVIDTDAEIERSSGTSIPEIFAGAGEARFRDLEHAALQSAIGQSRVILSTGGGIVLRPENRALLRAAGPSVWLTAAIDVLADRLSSGSRPALTTLSLREELRTLLAQRTPLYREVATLTLDTDSESPEDTAARVLAALDLESVSSG